MIKESQIREKVNELLCNRIDLDSFEDWLVSASWNMHRDSDEIAQHLVNAIELRLAELSSGHLSEARFRREVREVVPPNSGIIFVSKVNTVESRVISSGTSIWMDSPLMPLQTLKLVGI